VVFLENGEAFLRSHDEIAVLMKTYVGFRTEFLLEVAHEPEAEFGQLDIFRGRKLLAQAPQRPSGTAKLVGRVFLDDRNRARKSVFFEIVGGGTSDNAAAHNRYIDMLHDKTFCPIQNRLTRPGFTYFGTMAMQ